MSTQRLCLAEIVLHEEGEPVAYCNLDQDHEGAHGIRSDRVHAFLPPECFCGKLEEDEIHEHRWVRMSD